MSYNTNGICVFHQSFWDVLKRKGVKIMHWIIGFIIIVVIVLAYVSLYNGLVKAHLWVKEAWSQLDCPTQKSE